MRGATIMDWFGDTFFIISIHAPHAGRDRKKMLIVMETLHFNPRAPCGARPEVGEFDQIDILFQSTRPMRGATHTGLPEYVTAPISIHAPHAGRDIGARR